MKIIKILILLFFANINSVYIISQINDAVSYFPLKPGNKWVYSFYSTQFGQSGRFSRQVTSTNIYNGHIYYSYGGYYQRIDSLTANRYYYSSSNGCQWSPFDRMGDSLSAALNDTIKYDCGANYKVCSDTNLRELFGTFRRTKNFRLGNNGIIFARNFGIMELYTQSGNIFYVEHLRGCIIDGVVYGDTSLVGLNQISSEVPENYSLSQNYPNPFNPLTYIDFRIADFGFVKLTVFDVIGKEVEILLNRDLQPGSYKVDWDASAYPSGVYYYKLETEDYSETKKMVLIK